jgi:hypothetical protein
MASHIERRKFLATLGGAAMMWPLPVRAPPIAFISSRSADAYTRYAAGIPERSSIFRPPHEPHP